MPTENWLNIIRTKNVFLRHSLLEGLIAYYSFEDLLVDSSGNGNTLTNTNGVTQGAGVIGNAANFVAASSQTLNLTDRPSLDFTASGFSVACWAKVTGTSNRAFVQKGPSNNPAAYEWRLALNGGSLQMSVSDGTAAGAGTTAPTVGMWGFCFGSWDAGTGEILASLNAGTPATATKATILNLTTDMLIGGFNLMDGLIDEVGIWNRVLSPGNIADLYNLGNGRTYNFPGM